MAAEPLPDHVRRPHLRPIQPLPVTNKEGQQFVALRDPTMLVDQTLVVPLSALRIVQQFHGRQTIEEIATELGGEVGQFIELARRLDQVGLLWGPTFERLEEQQKTKIRNRGAFPAVAAATLGKDQAACRKAIEEYLDQTEDPEITGTIVGIVAPHLDYQRGWPNYAAAYYGLKDMQPPDRVVILGTNHFGLGDGVVLTEYGFDSPLGRCPSDAAVVSRLVEKLGNDLIVDQLDHMPEHSISLHVPWLQYRFGTVPLVAALVPDPLVPMIQDSASGRIGVEPFASALREVLNDVGGRTFFVASSDLSHVGPQFGEPRPVDEQRRIDVERHDRDMMGKFLTGDPEEFLGAMRWCNNPTRWCSVGNMTALLMLTRPTAPGQIELIDYRQAYDERGVAMVSSAAMAIKEKS